MQADHKRAGEWLSGILDTFFSEAVLGLSETVKVLFSDIRSEVNVLFSFHFF
jgi:hypothetical protein